MGKRLELHAILCKTLGSNNVYFQPPETIKMSYPCVVYTLSSIRGDYADNILYKFMKRYDVTFISRDPDNDYLDRMALLPYVSFDRRFASDGLYHDNFTMFY